MSAPAPPETRVVAGRVLCDLESGATRRDAAIVAENGRIVRIEAAPQDPASRALIALPAVVNAHDHGYGTPPMAFGAVDDALEPWICGLGGRPPTDPYLEAAVAFARMALGGISATVHCHNSFKAADLLEESAAVSRAAEDVGLRVAFSCPILDRNPWVYGGIEAVRSMFAPGDWAAVEQWVPRYEPADQQIARVEEVARRHERDGFAVQYGPVGPQRRTVSRWIRRAARASAIDPAPRRARPVSSASSAGRSTVTSSPSRTTARPPTCRLARYRALIRPISTAISSALSASTSRLIRP